MQNRLGMSNIITTAIMIALVLVSVGIIWSTTIKIIQLAPETFCSEFQLKNPFSITKACYLNENEIQINIKRNIDNLETNSLKFFFNNGATFQLQNKKCSDIRNSDSEYGKLCSLPPATIEKEYVFNLTREKISNKMSLEAEFNLEKNKIFCYLETSEIKGNC